MPLSPHPQPLIFGIERPVNTAFLLVHIRQHLTDEMAEKYSRVTADEAPSWLRETFEYQTISDIHLMRHRVRFRTFKGHYDWQPFIDYLTGEWAPSLFGDIEMQEVDSREPRRHYTCERTFEELLVIEGFAQSREDPLISQLFDIEGVIEVKGNGDQITIKKSPLYTWDELEPRYPAEVLREEAGK